MEKNYELHGRTAEVYVSVRYDITSEEERIEEFQKLSSEKVKVSRLNLLENLHFLVDNMLQPLANARLVRTQVCITNRKHL